MEIIRLNKNVPMPIYATAGSAAFDLTNQSGKAIVLLPGETLLVPTGLKMRIPSGLCGRISPRSGKALTGLTIVNSPGVVDSDYLGEVGIVLHNLSEDIHNFAEGERIAQMTIMPYIKASFTEVAEFQHDGGNERGEGGFGHTGKL